MVIDLIDVLTTSGIRKAYTVCLEMDDFSYQMGTYPIVQKDPIVLSIISTSKNKIEVSGEFSISIRIPCDRCLQDVIREVKCTIDRHFIIGDSEQSSTDEDMDEDVLTDTLLDVENLLFTEILINLPAKVLCKNDCKGICKVCGLNLNEGSCNCDQTVLDPRMAQFLDVFHSFGKSTD